MLMVVAVGGATLLAAAVTLSGCQQTPAPSRYAWGTQGVPNREPIVRVRLAASQQEVNIRSGGSVQVTLTDRYQSASPLVYRAGARITRTGGAFELRPLQAGRAVRWAVDELRLSPVPAGPNGGAGAITLGQSDYPGSLRLIARGDDRFDVINDVPMEDYLPGVIAKELYASWHPETFRAQAIAARSYAVVMLHRRQSRDYDMEASQASQAYIGITDHRKALDAVRDTRGVVLVYNGQTVPAYYSSASGGVGQDAVAAFPNEIDIPPLRGTRHGAWGQASTYYRWGPVARSRDMLSQRIAAWGRARGRPVAKLARISTIVIAQTNSVGRPTSFRITDSTGSAYDLDPEAFRFACNYTGAGLPDLPADQTLRSSHVDVSITADKIIIRGQGFGHGVGMCQFGAQAMAQQRYNHEAILAFYYPHAQLVRGY